jgi:hypothetical protein
MMYWAVEYKTGRTWTIDPRTIRRLRREALQAPLDINPTAVWWDTYNDRLRDGAARAVKVQLARLPR